MTVTPEELRQAAEIVSRATDEDLNELADGDTYWYMTADQLSDVAKHLEKKLEKAKRQDIRIVYHPGVDELRVVYIKKLDGNYCGVYLYSNGTVEVNKDLVTPPGETADFWSQDVAWEAPDQ